ncbi:unnamed protein product [Closterium sp. NIES-54]
MCTFWTDRTSLRAPCLQAACAACALRFLPARCLHHRRPACALPALLVHCQHVTGVAYALPLRPALPALCLDNQRAALSGLPALPCLRSSHCYAAVATSAALPRLPWHIGFYCCNAASATAAATSAAATASATVAATAAINDGYTQSTRALRTQWLTRNAAARLSVRNALPREERVHFGQLKRAKELYDAVVARYSSPSSAALGRIMLPYLHPELSEFQTVADLFTHLRASDARYRADPKPEFLTANPPPMYFTLYYLVTRLPDSLHAVRDHFLALDPTEITLALLEKHLLKAEKSFVTVTSSRGTPRSPFFEGCSPSLLAPSIATTAAVDFLRTEEVGAASAPGGRPPPKQSSLPVLSDPASDSLRAAIPTVAHLLSTVVTDPSFESTAASALVAELVDFAARCRLDYATRLVADSESVCPPSIGGECALCTDVLEDTQEEFQCFAAALPHLSAMDAEMASWNSTGTYVDEVPPPGANIVSGMWIFRVKRPPGSPPVFKAHYVARGFSQRQGVDYFQTFSSTPKMTTLRVLLHVAAQRDYELHYLDFSTAFLQGSLHEEIWLRRPPGFTGSFPPGTQWSLRRPVYGLRQAPREWHDTLRTTLAALGFAPSTADPSLFLRTDTSLPPF